MAGEGVPVPAAHRPGGGGTGRADDLPVGHHRILRLPAPVGGGHPDRGRRRGGRRCPAAHRHRDRTHGSDDLPGRDRRGSRWAGSRAVAPRQRPRRSAAADHRSVDGQHPAVLRTASIAGLVGQPQPAEPQSLLHTGGQSGRNGSHRPGPVPGVGYLHRRAHTILRRQAHRTRPALPRRPGVPGADRDRRHGIHADAGPDHLSGQGTMTGLVRRLAMIAGVITALVSASATHATGVAAAAATPPAAATPVQHFMFMMQGDRSFDNYFGTFPGADGIPDGVCQEFVAGRPDNGCVQPFLLDPSSSSSVIAGPNLINRQWNNGAMNRFVAAFHAQGRDGTVAMGHYDANFLPFYWSVAQNYVLFDRFFSSSRLGESTNRNYWVAAAPAPGPAADQSVGFDQPTIFDRLQDAGVSW